MKEISNQAPRTVAVRVRGTKEQLEMWQQKGPVTQQRKPWSHVRRRAEIKPFSERQPLGGDPFVIRLQKTCVSAIPEITQRQDRSKHDQSNYKIFPNLYLTMNECSMQTGLRGCKTDDDDDALK